MGSEQKKLYLSNEDKKICGVCGGFAEYFNIDPTVIRLGYSVFTIFSLGTGILLYFIAAVIMPERPKEM